MGIKRHPGPNRRRQQIPAWPVWPCKAAHVRAPLCHSSPQSARQDKEPKARLPYRPGHLASGKCNVTSTSTQNTWCSKPGKGTGEDRRSHPLRACELTATYSPWAESSRPQPPLHTAQCCTHTKDCRPGCRLRATELCGPPRKPPAERAGGQCPPSPKPPSPLPWPSQLPLPSLPECQGPRNHVSSSQWGWPP